MARNLRNDFFPGGLRRSRTGLYSQNVHAVLHECGLSEFEAVEAIDTESTAAVKVL
jgi:hypothetical protein